MKKVLVVLALLSMGSMARAESWWSKIGGNAPNLSGNYIYALSAKQSYGDMESTLFTEKINGNPIDFNLSWVPQTDIAGGGISYDLDNLPANFDYAWRGLVNVTISAGVIYDGAGTKALSAGWRGAQSTATDGWRVTNVRFVNVEIRNTYNATNGSGYGTIEVGGDGPVNNVQILGCNVHNVDSSSKLDHGIYLSAGGRGSEIG